MYQFFIGNLPEIFDTHVIARRLRHKQAPGGPITIENFVIDTIIIIIITVLIKGITLYGKLGQRSFITRIVISNG